MIKVEEKYMVNITLGTKEKLLVAKADKTGVNWLPLYIHLTDVAGVMKKLLYEYVSDSFHEMCGLSKNELKKAALFLAYSHDIGKATAVFQSKIIKAVSYCGQRLRKYDMEIPDISKFSEYKNTPHALAGENILLFFNCPQEIALVVGAHHGVPVNKKELDDQSFLLEDYPAYWKNYFISKKEEPLWKEVWKNYLEFAKQESGLERVEVLPKLHRQAQMLLTGLLIMADWIASNTNWFPLLSCDEWEFENDLEERVENGWEAFQLTDVWHPVNQVFSEKFFRQCFGFLPRKIQIDVLKSISEVSSPGIYIVEAPMGCGKTEIALSASEILAAKFDRTGLFFGLPTQATANGIFSRVLEWAKSQSEDVFQSIQLVHGASMLNKNFMDIERGIPDCYDDVDGGVVVHSWFCGKKQSCLADFVVGTVDQFLMAALKRKHVMLLHLGLSQKVVVIDEVHAYDAYMNCYLERALSWLGIYRVPVIMLSATLPAERRNNLIKSYLNVKKVSVESEKKNEYPLITWTDGEDIMQKSLSYEGVHKQVQIEILAEEQAFLELEQVIEAGGCVGIILNTVKRVQRIAEMIQVKYPENVILYHAQYIFPDRMSQEEKILKMVGKSSTKKERQGTVVVGSQVLEQSLDLDFDLLVTDLCPIDLLLQRIGRLHRHKEHDSIRPECVKSAKCIILGADTSEFEDGAKKIYGNWLLTRTKSVLPKLVQIPDDISVLVQKVYGACNPMPEEMSFYEEYCMERKKKEEKAKAFLLKKANSKDNIHGLLDAGIADVYAEASVRDGISSVEVLVLVKDSDDKIFFLPWQNHGMEILDTDILDVEICKKIAEQKLRLPSVLCQMHNIEDTIKEIENQSLEYIASWQQSVWLKGELVLFFNKDLESIVNGYQLRYNKKIGLSYEKLE